MSILSPEQWHALGPHLDEALEMSEKERSIWLSSLRAQDPALADQLEMLLHEHRALTEKGFLERRSVELPAASTMADQTLGVYKLISPIGQGGMSSVWLAERNDGRFERQVAVKFLNIALMGKIGEERFQREGRILGHLAHPHIAELIDAGVSQAGQPYLVLEYVKGDHVDCYCDEQKLNLKARIRIFLDVLAAVEHAHANLIVHRDLKPSNVLVRTDGQVKLLDFGIAKLIEGEGESGAATLLTREGGALTPAYAAPEQLTGHTITTATDVYSLGVSGGNMVRPGLKKLLEDIAAGKIDTVVVYKVDRLTRSLADFAKIVETFDGKGVSFVSVTQQFNTTTSMGRLTLNVLLSFAQFEREVTGERIRDKVAASKKKGMWMGGIVPLGYDHKDRQLHVNGAEAEQVRHIFDQYLRLRSVFDLYDYLKTNGYRSKQRVRVDGRSKCIP